MSPALHRRSAPPFVGALSRSVRKVRRDWQARRTWVFQMNSRSIIVRVVGIGSINMS